MPDRSAGRSPERLVVIGGDAAGMSAATNARRRRSPDDLEILVFERGAWVSFSACGQPYYLAGTVEPFERLLIRSPEAFARSHIHAHLWHEVTAIDVAARTVTVRNLNAGTDETVAFDYLMYATGASASLPGIPGLELTGVHPLHRLDDAQAIRRILDEERPRRGVIVGGGYVGLEVAEAFLDRGLETAILTRGSGLLTRTLDDDMSDLLATKATDLGIHLVHGSPVDALEGKDGRVTTVRCDRGTLPADLVIMATGVRPNVDLARDAGIRVGKSGALWVDDRMQTSVPGIYAGGDCAESTHRVSGKPVNYHLGDVANKHGRIAGLNIGGADERFPGILGTAITKLRDVEVATTGLTHRDALAAGLDALATSFDSTTAAGYWPASTPMTMKVVFEQPSGRLLGAQIIGGPGAGKRIDAIATALWTGMTVHELLNVDLAYAPPFSGVWDPVLVAARKASGLLGGNP